MLSRKKQQQQQNKLLLWLSWTQIKLMETRRRRENKKTVLKFGLRRIVWEWQEATIPWETFIFSSSLKNSFFSLHSHFVNISWWDFDSNNHRLNNSTKRCPIKKLQSAHRIFQPLLNLKLPTFLLLSRNFGDIKAVQQFKVLILSGVLNIRIFFNSKTVGLLYASNSTNRTQKNMSGSILPPYTRGGGHNWKELG